MRTGWLLVVLSATNLHAGAPLLPVDKPGLCVTEGTIEELPGHRLSVNVPKMRAYVNAMTPPIAEVRFTYLGPTRNDVPLASGAMRRQFGIKLRAQDACNLVYAMWRIEPEAKLVVSIKSNPGQHTSAECTNHGYQNIKPRRTASLPSTGPDQTHTLRAEMNGSEMQVFADNSLVWEGSLGPEVLALDGPVGIRSDNVNLEFELRAGQSMMGPRPGCRAQETE